MSEGSSGARKLGRTIDQLRVGDHGTFTKTITDQDIYLYMGITGDFNPIYVDSEYASRTRFREPIVPGILLAGLIVAGISTELPGKGTITVSQHFNFVAPAKRGDVITCEIELIEVRERENRVVLRTTARNQNGELVVTGKSEVMPPPKVPSVLSYAFEDYP
ncbi:MAG: MaoC family dehydratase [Bacillota bacterium]|nr:MaoC family dehydratase [Bacillota bacterium]